MVLLAGVSTGLHAGVLHSYSFDGNTNDGTGSANGAIVGSGVTLTTDRFGNANSAYQFGGGGYVLANFASAISAPGTFSLWASMDALPVADMLFSTTIAASPDLFFVATGACGTPNINWNTYDSCANPIANADNAPFFAALGTSWHHYVVVAPSSAPMQLYIDGTLIGTANFRSLSGSTFGIGGDNNGFDWHGKIDDVAFFDTALSASEVAALDSSSPEPGSFTLLSVALALAGGVLAKKRLLQAVRA